MARPVWFVNILKRLFPERFTLAKFTRFPLLGSIVDNSLFKGDDVMYLPKDHTIQINTPIEIFDNIVLPSQIVDHFIHQAGYHWLMNFCICRDSNHCKEYPNELGCLFLGEAVLGIGKEYGRLVSKEKALEHVRRCREAGLVHLIGRNKLDTVWLGIGPGEKLLTICNCCPCCCLWKILPYLNTSISNKITRMPGVTVSVKDLCTGCGTCTQGVCFVDAIQLIDGKAVIGEECRGCGNCVEVCPNEAIELTIKDSYYVNRAIDHITPLVDIS